VEDITNIVDFFLYAAYADGNKNKEDDQTIGYIGRL
jgi:hypothetical protein